MSKEKVKPRSGLAALLSDHIDLSKDEKQLQYAFWIPIVSSRKSVIDAQGNIKPDKSYVSDIKIDYLNFYDFLYNEGFRRYNHFDETFYVQITSGRILKRVKINAMQDAVSMFIQQLPEDIKFGELEYKSRLIESTFVLRQGSLFDEKRLQSQLRPKTPIEFNRDTHDTKFMYFLNGYLEINREGVRFKKYKELKGYIWDSELLRREYTAPKTIPEKDYVRRFLLNVSGGNQKRFRQLMNITGYLMHNYLDYKLKCVLLTDGVIDEEGDANGRSGKTLYARIVGGAISHDPRDPAIKSYIEINGKDFDTNDKHKYSTADIDTKLIVLNDLRRFFDVDSLFNDITEGMTVDKKSLQPFRIQTKLIATTNKVIKIEGGSSKDRFIEFEFSDHYSAVFSPLDEFGHWFFKAWDQEDFCRYYTFMAQCAHTFLKDGSLAIPEQINLNKRKLLDTTDKDFLDFIENDWKPESEKLYEKTAICAQFQEAFPDWKNPTKKFSQNRFSTWFKNYLNYHPEWENFIRDKNEKRQNEGGKTVRYYIFIKKKEL